MQHQYFISAIGTDSGKTLVSAILVEHLKAHYWKPIQAGLPKDTDQVKELISNKNSIFLKERFCLSAPMSPHAAAKIDKIEIKLSDFELPIESKNQNLIVEGAGGLFVPINYSKNGKADYVIDLIEDLKLPLILVCNLYLGSINHTILSLEAIKNRNENRNINLKGIILNGESNPDSEQIIEDYIIHNLNSKIILRIKQEKEITKEIVKRYASQIIL
ncbi:dethiobiotin synthase [Bernardetia litoralis DSM 6794]|uniref:ATP-dependent dethiobiotin synthetase BioD n=1 Tax=Bernardetia litoralis (strain ATCC 23117 / DSM 6794 / NBRC 15988 / NCIMB 1366 / Fx l1 / Sio-4) TaxID=880071 RepID=I4AK41_BERLS|nr:dethiobiotin synthase [Bernardetia litoralis]AFM04326.1 dethiobiotin synthase [Bernardetia litoralis DSM 6794]